MTWVAAKLRSSEFSIYVNLKPGRITLSGYMQLRNPFIRTGWTGKLGRLRVRGWCMRKGLSGPRLELPGQSPRGGARTNGARGI